MNLTIKARLIGSLAALGVGMVAIGASGLVSTSIGQAKMQTVIADRVLPMQQLKAVSDLYAVNIVDAAHKARGGSITPADAQNRINEARSKITPNWDAYSKTEMSGDELVIVPKLKAALPAADAAIDQLQTILRST